MSGSYMLYCDESGQRDYGKGTDKHFVVSGVMVSDEDATHLEDEIRGFKRALWGNPDIEIKSNWIRQPKEREKHYTQPHGLSGSDINGLLELLIKWIAKAPITFFAGVVDKPGMQSKYPEPHYAGAVAYTMLLQRFQKTLSARSSTGNVIFDDPAGKSPGGHDWRTLLRNQHSKLKRFGCPYTKTKFDDVGSINFADSASSAFVQVADLVAYNTFRQFRDHGSAYDSPDAKELSLYPQFEAILGSFDRDTSGTFAGRGIAYWPSRAKNKWAYKPAA